MNTDYLDQYITNNFLYIKNEESIIFTLPIEIIEYAFQFLPGKDIVNISMACKTFYQICQSRKIKIIVLNYRVQRGESFLEEYKNKKIFFRDDLKEKLNVIDKYYKNANYYDESSKLIEVDLEGQRLDKIEGVFREYKYNENCNACSVAFFALCICTCGCGGLCCLFGLVMGVYNKIMYNDCCYEEKLEI